MKKCGNGKIEKVFSMYPITIPAIVVCILLCFVLFFYNIYVAVVGLYHAFDAFVVHVSLAETAVVDGVQPYDVPIPIEQTL